MKKNILVIAAHPDDEVLGCGGTLALLAKQGAQIHIAFLADGVTSRESSLSTEDELASRRAAAHKACKILGINSISFGEFPDNRMDSVVLIDVVKFIENLILEHNPDTVFTHHTGDVNIDHRCIHDAVIVACRPQQKCPVKTLLFFEVPSSTEWQTPDSGLAFLPNWFSDISSTLELKLKALDAYDEELRDWPHPRSNKGVEHLARWRGAIVGVDAAEAFILGRNIVV